MIELPFSNGKTHQIKNSWDELSPEQYMDVIDAIAMLLSQSITILQFRVKLFEILSGVKVLIDKKSFKSDLPAENIYRITRYLTFPIRIEYENAKSFSSLKKDIREKLLRFLPEELDSTPEVRWAEKNKKAITPDLAFPCNLIPQVGRRRHVYKGYSFNLTDGILQTSLTTAQFIDAQTVSKGIQEAGSETLLNLLTAILYSGNSYSALQAGATARSFDSIPIRVKKAIFINFNAIQEYLYTRTKYAILFNAPSPERAAVEGKPKHNLGLGVAVHSLIKSGYADIENSNLLKFFDIMYSDLISNVTSLHKQGKTVDEISELTGITLSKINQII
ncbi:MAG: hypothetical protein JZU49_00985 [Sulfuricurvum sp.]|nr:hypothetical protein [Sulfuricurvum sp.]